MTKLKHCTSVVVHYVMLTDAVIGREDYENY